MTASEDGLAGLDLAWDEPPDLVRLDLVMPALDGWEVLLPPRTAAQAVL